MIETRRLKNVVIFFQTILSFVLSRKIKKIIPLTTDEKIYHNKQKICNICKKEFNNNDKKN